MSSRIYVVGAGAIGAFLAARMSPLAPTTVIVRDESREKLGRGVATLGAIQEPGFRPLDLRGWTEVSRFEPEAMVWLTCKAFDLPEVLEQVRRRSDGTQTLILFQNGIGILELARQRIPEGHWARAACWFGVRLEGLAQERRAILHVAGIDSVEFAFPHESSQPGARFGALLQAGGIPPVVQASPDAVEWRKGLWNLSANGLCAIAEAPNGWAATDAWLRPVADQLYFEAAQVVERLGVELGDREALREQCFAAMVRTGTNLNSTLMDLRAGRRTEMDWLNGALVRIADGLGVVCPTHRVVLHLVRSLEESRARMRG
jgi:2-dehydropantoate 2-reductase